MNTRNICQLATLLSLVALTSARAQGPPQLLHYQGRVADNNGNFNGQGQFKFALVNGDGTVSHWSNDGQSGVNLEPAAHVQLLVDHGLFSLLLGDAGTVIPYTVFDNPDVRLRVWFRPANNNGPFEMFTPDQRIVSVGYAMRAANVIDGAITGAQLAPGAITGTNVAHNSLTSSDIADILTLETLNLGGLSWDGTLNLFARPVGGGGIVNPAGELRGVLLGDALGSEFGLYFSDGTTGATLSSRTTGGRLQLKDAAGNDTTVELGAGGNAGGFLTLRNPGGLTRAFLQGGGVHDGGELQLRDSTGANRLRLYGNAPGYIIDTPSAGGLDMFDLGGLRRIAMRGADGTLHLPQANGNEGVFLSGQALGASGGILRLGQGDGDLGVLLRGDSGGSGLIDVASLNGFARVRLDGSSTNDSGEVSVFDDNGTETIELLGASSAVSGGQLIMRGNGGTTTVRLNAEYTANQGAELTMFNSSGDSTVVLNADNVDNSGSFLLGSGTGHYGLFLDGGTDGYGRIQVRNSAGNGGTRVQIDGEGEGSGGQILVQDASGTATVRLLGAQTSTSGGRIELHQADGTNTVILDGEVGNGGGGYLQLRNGSGVGTITLDSDFSGEGRITTQVLQITGGSDLSEQFNVRSAFATPEPGMIVCIDPKNPGELAVSARAYDRTVAGVMSGAGGVKPGMLMGQAGSKADGKHPVALTGRVYCLVNASRSAIEPGDLITSSETPGHGMKVTDHARAQGAIIGKAMTGLATGRGLVLVLVSLQ